jgi:hypothetical protein
MNRGLQGRLAWLLGVSVLWPAIGLAAFHVVVSSDELVIRVIAWGFLIALLPMLGVAAAEGDARWRRAIGATVQVTTFTAVVLYGVLVVGKITCVETSPLGVGLLMIPYGALAGVAAGLMAWQGGRIVSAWGWRGAIVAFFLGEALLAFIFLAGAYQTYLYVVPCLGP